MGQANSKEYDYDSQSLTWPSLFSPKIIAFIKNDFEHRPSSRPNDGQSVDFIPLAMLLENLISMQRSDGQHLTFTSDISNSFFNPIIRDVDVHFDQARNFSKYFETIRTLASTILNREQTKYDDNLKIACTKFGHLSQHNKDTTQFLEDLITPALQFLLPHVDVLSEEEVLQHLNNLNYIFSSQKPQSLAALFSSSVSTINQFVGIISQIDKFKIPEIQKQIITFLYNMSHVQGNVCGCLSALTYMIELPIDFIFPTLRPLLIDSRIKFSASSADVISSASSAGDLQQLSESNSLSEDILVPLDQNEQQSEQQEQDTSSSQASANALRPPLPQSSSDESVPSPSRQQPLIGQRLHPHPRGEANERTFHSINLSTSHETDAPVAESSPNIAPGIQMQANGNLAANQSTSTESGSVSILQPGTAIHLQPPQNSNLVPQDSSSNTSFQSIPTVRPIPQATRGGRVTSFRPQPQRAPRRQPQGDSNGSGNIPLRPALRPSPATPGVMLRPTPSLTSLPQAPQNEVHETPDLREARQQQRPPPNIHLIPRPRSRTARAQNRPTNVQISLASTGHGDNINANAAISLSALPSTNLINLNPSISALPSSTSLLNMSGAKYSQKQHNMFELPLAGLTEVVSFTIGGNVMILARENVLAVFRSPEVFILNVFVADDSILFDAYDYIYIISESDNSIQMINTNDLEQAMNKKAVSKDESNPIPIVHLKISDPNDSESQGDLSCETLSLSSFVSNESPVVAIGCISSNDSSIIAGGGDRYITIVQKVDEKSLLFSIFPRNIKLNDNKPSCQIKQDLDYHPTRYYFEGTNFHVVDEVMKDYEYEFIPQDGDDCSYRVAEKSRTFCPYVFVDAAPFVCYKNYYYTLSYNNDNLIFVQYSTTKLTGQKQTEDETNIVPSDSMVYVKNFPFRFSPLVIPSYTSDNFKDSIKQVCNTLTASIDQLLQKCFEDVSIISNRVVSYFISSDKSSVDISLNLIEKVIDAPISDNLKIAMISLSIKIITLNMYLYCLKFSKGIDNYTEEDIDYQKKIKKAVRKAAFCEYAKKSPNIIESICALFYFNFRYLYFPSYKEFGLLFKQMVADDVLKYYLMMNYLLLSHSPCSLYMMSNEFFSSLENSVDKAIIYRGFDHSIDTLTQELQFLTDNNITNNEAGIVPYFESLITFLSGNLTESITSNYLQNTEDKSSQLPINLVQKTIFRLMCIDSFPLISSAIVSASIPLISEVTKVLFNDSEIVKVDSENSTIHKSQKNKVVVFESDHDYRPKMDILTPVDFTGCSSIHIEFDPKCSTVQGQDFLTIYDKNNKPLYKYSGNNWSKNIDIDDDYLILKFTSGDEPKGWGYRLVVTANTANNESREFNPNSTLFFFNLVWNTLGRLTNIALKSLPISEKESEYKLILESDIIRGMDNINKFVADQKVEQSPLQPVTIPDENKVNSKSKLTRGISRGISFDATNAGMQYPDEVKKGFLNDLISPTPMENGWAAKLLQFMYKDINKFNLFKPRPEVLECEKYAVAALMKQLGFLNVAISFAMSLGSGDPKSVTAPPNLHRTWEAIYQLRSKLCQSYQKFKRAKPASPEGEKAIPLAASKTSTSSFLASQPLIPLSDNYDAYIEEVKLKCQLLLYNNPILKKKFGDSEVYDSKTIETTIKELIQFILSNLQMENISNMISIRSRRIRTRLSSLNSIIKIVGNRDLFKTSQISFLEPLDQSLSILSNRDDVMSVKAEMIDELNSKFSDLIELLVSRITDQHETELHRLLFLKLIAVDLEGIVPCDVMARNFLKVADFAEKCPTKPIELYATLSCLWRLIGIWSIETPLKEIQDALLRFTIIDSNEICQKNAILLLSVLTQLGDFTLSSFEPINNCFKSKNPSVIIASLIWLASAIVQETSLNIQDFNVTIRDKQYNFTAFLHLLLKSCGCALGSGFSYLIPDECLPQSHKMVAEEIIAFFRMVIKPFSVVNSIVIQIIHDVFTNCSQLNFVNLGDSQDEIDNVHELIAVFAILGKETIPFHSSGFGIQNAKETSELTRIIKYEQYASKLVFLNHDNVEQTANEASFAPSSRILSDPSDFSLNQEDVKLINSLQQALNQSFNQFVSIDFAILAANFIGFLVVSLQNPNNMKVFIDNVDIDQFFALALKHLDVSVEARSLGTLISRIGQLSSHIQSLISIITKMNAKNLNKNKKLIELSTKESNGEMNDAKRHQVARDLPYSLVFNHEPTHCLFPITFGNITKQLVQQENESTMKEHFYLSSIPNKKCLFVGNKSMPNTTLFYFEIKILSLSSNRFMIGLIDQRSETNNISFFGLDFATGNPISLYLHYEDCEPIPVQVGDVIGCGYTRNEILFFKNGVDLKSSIQFPLIDDFVPVVITNNCELKFECNFGQEQFVTNLIKFKQFDIDSDCLEQIDVPVPIEAPSIPPSANNDFDDSAFDSFVGQKQSLFEIAKPYHSVTVDKTEDQENPNILDLDKDEEDSLYFPEQVSQQKNSSSDRPCKVNYVKQTLFSDDIFIGQPVLITRGKKIKADHAKSKKKDDAVHPISDDDDYEDYSDTDEESVSSGSQSQQPTPIPSSNLTLHDSSALFDVGAKDDAFAVSNQHVASEESQFYINRYGTVVDIEPIQDSDKLLLTIEVFDYTQHENVQFQIESRFVEPVTTPFLNVVESSARLFTLTAANASLTTSMLLHSPSKPSTDDNSKAAIQQLTAKTAQALSEHTAKIITKNLFDRRVGQLHNSAKNLIIRMCRILFVIILDYYRSEGKINELVDTSKHPLSIDVFSHAILEVFKFNHSLRASDKWNLIRRADFIFGEKDQRLNSFSLTYCCPCNRHAFSRCIRAILYQSSNDIQRTVSELIKNALVHISTSPQTTRQKIFKLIPNRYVIETPHPMPDTTLDFKLDIPDACVGFLPVLHPLHSTLDRVLMVSNHPIRDSVSDCCVFSPKDCRINFKNSAPFKDQCFGLKFGILLLTDYLQEYLYNTPLSSIQVLSTLLSVVLSSKESFTDVIQLLKHEVIPGIAKLMNRNNFFVDLFAFDFIAPILTTFKWNPEDITPLIVSSFNCFTSNIQATITQWAALNVNSQQAIVMSVFTRLLILDAAAARITPESSPEEIGQLYDTYVETTVGPDAPVFEQMFEAISICTALAFDLPISIRFPAFLIAQSWAESIPFTLEVNSDKGSSVITNYSFNQFSKAEIEFVKSDSLPPNSFLRITTATQNSSTETYNLYPGKTGTVKSPFSAELIDSKSSTRVELPEDKFFTVTLKGYPESHEAKREKFVNNYSIFQQHVNFMAEHWQVKMDERLCRIAKSMPSIYNACPLDLSDPAWGTETILSHIPVQLLRCRLQLFKSLNEYIPNIIRVVEFGNQESLLGTIFTSCRAAISTQFKLNTVEKVVLVNLSSSSIIDLKFNRFKASIFHTKPPNGQSLLAQFISQVPISDLPQLKRQNTPWHVDLIGEGATDAGGPGRDLFTEACMEIMHPSLGLFISNPNKRVNNESGNRELLIPNPRPMTEQTKTEYFYSGALMALCYISKIPEPFKFARFVWNYLTNRPVSIEDIYEVDLKFQEDMAAIENCDTTITPDQFTTMFQLSFTVQNSLGEVVELINGGASIPVTFERRNEYVQRCKIFRMKEFNAQLEQLKKGFNFFFPATAATILSPWELELLICGDNQCPVSEMKKNLSYNSSESHISMLWSVLEEFTPEERMLFIKFGCGRMGLPPPGMSWSQKLAIQFKSYNDQPDPMKPLPSATTCSSTMTIPRYETKEWMAKKIRAAITMGADIDQDRNANLRDLTEFT